MKIKRGVKLVIFPLALVTAGGAFYAWSEYNRKVEDLAHVKPALKTDAPGLIRAFETDEQSANTAYLGKIIAVEGNVSTLEKDELGHYTLVLSGGEGISSVRCSMDSTHQQDVSGLQPGIKVSVKGACTGFNPDEMLGSDVILNRCVLDN